MPKLWIVTDGDDGGLAVCTTREFAEELLADTKNVPYSKCGRSERRDGTYEGPYYIEEITTDMWIGGHAG